MPAVQKYRKAWENIPQLSGWLCEIPEEPVRAYCNVCKIKLQAHKSSLLDHKKTARHIFGELSNSTDNLNTSHMLDSFSDAVHHFIEESKEHTEFSPIKNELPVVKRTSLIWRYFTKINKLESSCNLCSRNYKSSGNTTNLRKHLQFNHPEAFNTLLNSHEESFNMWIADKKKQGWNKHNYDLDLFGKCIAAQMKKLPEEQAIKLTVEIQNIIAQARLEELQEQKMVASINIEEKNFQVQYANENHKIEVGPNIPADDYQVQYVNEDYVNGGQIVIVSPNE